MTTNYSETSSFSGVYFETKNEDPFPETEHLSKKVMIRGERGDSIAISDAIQNFDRGTEIPSEATIVRRTEPYFGPKLLLEHQNSNYLLTAPGPDSQLLLWSSVINKNGNRTGWKKHAEVTVRFSENLPSYDHCPQCGEPLKTLKHEKQAELGCCPSVQIK